MAQSQASYVTLVVPNGRGGMAVYYVPSSYPLKRDKKLKHEDSVWKKTIILGEKCRVRHDSEEEVVFDEDGNRITSYRPKTSAAPPSMSRQSSAVDAPQPQVLDAVMDEERQREFEQSIETANIYGVFQNHNSISISQIPNVLQNQ
nr:Phosphatidylinositol 3,4,5-trisphosphate 5-phosphatase [Ipomoea batatas]